MNEQRLKGELALVTGSDSGIGQAIAIAFAEEGADVIVTYLHDRKGADDTAYEVEAAGCKAAIYQLDHRESKQVQQLFQDVKTTIGIPTILVNNAGISAADKMVKDLTDNDWDDAIKTDLYGPFYCCREFIRAIDLSRRKSQMSPYS